jgi:hypothetical protein
MVGYTRQDTANNIANGNVIDADDLDSEFNAVEDSFNAISGHTHDGTPGNGSPVTKVGPSQDIIVGTTNILPKGTNTIDLGSAAAQFKDAWFDGTVSTDTLNVGVSGFTTIVDNEYDVASGNLTFDVAGDIVLDADGGDVYLKDGGVDFGRLVNNSNQLSVYSGTTEALALSGANTSAKGSLAVATNATVGGTLAVTGNTSVSAGNLTVNTGNVSIGGTLGVTGTITGTLSGTVSSLGNHTTNSLAEGTKLYYTDARVKAAIGVTDAGGDGSLTYSNGNITYTGPSATEVRNHFSAGTGVGIAGGVVSIGQPVGTTSNVVFGNVTASGNAVINGNLTVSGTTTTINTETVNIADNQIVLNSNFTGTTPTQNGGIEIERGSQPNKTFVWDETTDKWTVGSEALVAGSFQGPLTGNASTATALQTARTISLAGDVSGSVSFNGTSNVSITAVVADDSHNHVISNIDGLQTALDSKALLAGSTGQVFYASRSIVANGSAGSPSIAFASDGGVDTGFYWGGDGYINFTTNGSYAGQIDPSNNLTMAGNVTAYSDRRLKSDIVTIPNALDTVSKLRGVNFTKDGKASTGVIAQEVQQVMPEVVHVGEEYLSVAYGNLVGVLIEAVKELKAEVEALKKGL